jgi:hypothetical protein
MKRLTIGILFITGALMAQEQVVQEQVSQEQATPKQAHLSEDQRIALRTQSPSVKTHSRKHSDKPAKYTVTENKSTIVATRTYDGK